ncbi:hypothetical protein HWV62_40599 [Athelia sp. TMB]|nr:hypothetical protein HWV62_40599 [Athelia sp. TMB]
MALPMLVGGADCGPSNPLQNLSKRFDQDRGIQQTFRTQATSRGPDQDAARFFNSNQGSAPQFAPGPFDLSSLSRTLPPAHFQQPQPQQQQRPLAAWATDFMQAAKPAQAPSPQVMSPSREAQQERNMQMDGGNLSQQAQSKCIKQALRGKVLIEGKGMSMQMPTFVPQMPMGQQQQHTPSIQVDHSALWEKAEQDFQSMARPADIKAAIEPTGPAFLANEIITQTQPALDSQANRPHDTDELARTAGMLVDSLRDEQNAKFKNSAFMGLMRQLRDHEVVVEGDKMVENTGGAGSSWASDFRGQSQVDVKGKGRAMDVDMAAGAGVAGQLPRAFSHHIRAALEAQSGPMQHAPALNALQDQNAAEASQEEDATDAYMRQENAEFAKYWDAHHHEQAQHATSATAQAAEWGHLQDQWERFEATATGIKAVEAYPFQQQNPYLAGDRSRTRHHTAHLEGPQSFYESVLEMEAAVQRDPQNATAWFELGVKQQENEREQKAIIALRRAVELDPTHLPTWIALGVSYTNDNNRMGTYDAINQWVQRNEKYTNDVMRWRATNPERGGADGEATIMEKFNSLIQCLISMARGDMSGEVDADIQIALAVLLNTNEDYEKAHDCFRAALEVRPDDWLLYNRVGATLANSGKAEDALQFYYGALALNPAYIRARYNLGISCNNLRRYDEAAQHILDALVLQDSDGVRDTTGLVEQPAITSSALWDSLKTTCMHMQRADLAALCDRQDLEGFRVAYQQSMTGHETHA